MLFSHAYKLFDIAAYLLQHLAILLLALPTKTIAQYISLYDKDMVHQQNQMYFDKNGHWVCNVYYTKIDMDNVSNF